MSNLVNRMAYETLKRQYADAKISTILTESTLTLVQPIVANSTRYQFDVLTTEGNNLSWESRLNQSDSMHATSVELYIGAGAAADDPEAQLYTYPAEIIGATYDDYYVVYNSTMDWSISNVKYLQNFDNHKFLCIPTTQRLSAAANQNFNEIGGHVNDVAHYFATSIQLSGARKNDIVINLAQSVAVPVANTYLVLKISGIQAIGGSIFQS